MKKNRRLYKKETSLLLQKALLEDGEMHFSAWFISDKQSFTLMRSEHPQLHAVEATTGTILAGAALKVSSG